CAVFGVFGVAEAAQLTYLGLHALQHRGQESSGMVVGDGQHWRRHAGMGLVDQVYSPALLRELPGNVAIGHNRSSTSGTSTLDNAQPVMLATGPATLALCHNGNLLNASELAGTCAPGTSDTRILGNLLAAIPSDANWTDAVVETLRSVRGA